MLVALILYSNKLVVSIPLEINNITKSKELDVGYNKLTGHFPENICLNGSLEHLGAANNHIIGPIPKSF